MRTHRRPSRLLVALGLILGLIATTFGNQIPAAAESPAGTTLSSIFFPWVPNGERLSGIDQMQQQPYFGTIAVQNVEDFRIMLRVVTGVDRDHALHLTLESHASATLSAAQLRLPGCAQESGGEDAAPCASFGGGITVQATWSIDPGAGHLPAVCTADRGGLRLLEAVPRGLTVDGVDTLAGGDIISIDHISSSADDNGISYYPQRDFIWHAGKIDWSPPGLEPNAPHIYYVFGTKASCTRAPAISGVEKQMAPGTARFTGKTSTDGLVVDGYSAIPDTDVAWGPASFFCQDAQDAASGTGSGPACNNLGQIIYGLPTSLFGQGKPIHFDGQSYLPIVQVSDHGWNTVLHLTNLDTSSPDLASVNVRLFATGNGAGNRPTRGFETMLAPGETVSLDLAADLGLKDFVGSAWISSDYGIVTNATRYRRDRPMAMTVGAAPSLYATTSLESGQLGTVVPSDTNSSPYQLYAPLVYHDYNGWNTGINLLNLSENALNQVSIQLFNRAGVAIASYVTAIPAKGMKYVYLPATQDLGLGKHDFGGAVLTGQLPFLAAIDEVKYATGEAMSYPATGVQAVAPDKLAACQGNAGSCADGSRLSLALFQTGEQLENGGWVGDLSGINLFNPGDGLIKGVVRFNMPDGTPDGPSIISGVPFNLTGHASMSVYAPSMSSLTPGMRLAATVEVQAGDGSLTAVSNVVNAQVGGGDGHLGDGGAVFNLVNSLGQYRVACSQTSCGFRLQLPNGSISILPPWSADRP